MRKQSRLVSFIAMVAICMSFLAPAFLAPAPVSAATTYTALTCPVITVPATGITLGKIAVDIPEVAAMTAGDTLSVSLPSGVSFGTVGLTSAGAVYDVMIDDTVSLSTSYATGELGAGSFVATATSAKGFDLVWTGAANKAFGNARFIISFDKLNVSGMSGDIEASFSTQANSGFTGFQSVVIGKTVTGGSAVATVSSTKSLNASGAVLDTITFIENVPGTFTTGDVITLTLPQGFSWRDGATGSGGWGLTGNTGDNTGTKNFTIKPVAGDARKMTVKLENTFMGSPAAGNTGSGRLAISTAIDVDDSVARAGDVNVDISCSTVDIATKSLLVAKYGTFGITFEENNPKDELIAGKSEVAAGNILIKEDAPGSIIPTRDFRLTLPSGVKWFQNPTTTTLSGTALGYTVSAIGTDKQSVKVAVNAGGSTASATTVKVGGIKLHISPAFSGDIICEIAGSQGVTGKVKLGTVKPAIEVKADGAATNVTIGATSQTLPDILITETAREAIRAKDGNNQAVVTLILPPAVTFTSTPTVTVSEGDLIIDTVGITKTSAFGGIYRGALNIPIKGTSTTPSTIKVSGIKVGLDRTVPEGAFSVAVGGALGTDPFDANVVGGAKLFNYEAVAAARVANCVTPAAADQGRTASFWIGSTIMNVNGANIIMDVAPYIKAGRTYVPVRYLGDALGAETSWDDATKTVTVTKGDKTVVLVIGSKTAKVNGEDVAMDVAPEIVNGRTMLPARYVAEGLGYQVGWNEALRQVVIQ